MIGEIVHFNDIMLTYKQMNNNKTMYNDSPLGKIPSDWEVKELWKAGIEIINGDRGDNYPSEVDLQIDGYCLFLNAKNVTNNGFSFIDNSFITIEKDEKLRKGKLQRFDLVYQNSDKEPKLGVQQIITLCKIRNGIFQRLNPEIVSQLENSGLIQKTSGHTSRYTLSEDYHKMVIDGLKIGKKYIVKEIEQLLLTVQGNSLKIGDLEKGLKESLSRNQIKYLMSKLMEDDVLKKEGKIKGARYSITGKYADLRGDVLISEVVADLRRKHEKNDSL